MDPAPTAADFADRRDAPRAAIDRQYSMRLDPCDGRAPFTCAVLDHSVTGMRLEMPDDVVLPVDVHILIGEIAHNARVVWRKANVVGVDLIDEHHSIF
jgi:hypothetical protein